MKSFKEILEAKGPEEGDYSIMDMGPDYPVKLNITMVDANGKKTNEISRYGVWIMSGMTAKEVVDQGNDLKKLQKKYNVPDRMVYQIKK